MTFCVPPSSCRGASIGPLSSPHAIHPAGERVAVHAVPAPLPPASCRSACAERLPVNGSVLPDAEPLDHLGPARQLLPHDHRQRLRPDVARLHRLRREPFAHRRQARWRGAGRRRSAPPPAPASRPGRAPHTRCRNRSRDSRIPPASAPPAAPRRAPRRWWRRRAAARPAPPAPPCTGLWNIACTWPPSSAACAGAAPPKGTWVKSTPARLRNSSAVRCVGVPTPAEVMVTSPGLARSSASNSGQVRRRHRRVHHQHQAVIGDLR